MVDEADEEAEVEKSWVELGSIPLSAGPSNPDISEVSVCGHGLASDESPNALVLHVDPRPTR